MYTLDQLTNATLDQVKSDPALLKAFTKLYFGAGATEANETQLLRLWTSQDRNFNSDKDYVIKQFNVSDGSELARNVDRYINWNNTAKPEDLAAANKEREKAMIALDEKAQQLAKIGIDIKSIPQYATFYKQLGVGSEAQTSAQTARDLGQTTVNLPDNTIRSASELQGASVGTYKTGAGASVGTFKGQDNSSFQSNTDNLPDNIPYQTQVSQNIPFKSGLTETQKNGIIALSNKPISQWSATDKQNWNYATNGAPVPGTPNSTGSPTIQNYAGGAIPFRSGLTDVQKTSISNLQNKPISQWTQTDRANWSYATNNAPITGESSTQVIDSSSINFKPGLNDAQKASIVALSRKDQSQWTQTDRDNWNYATVGNTSSASNYEGITFRDGLNDSQKASIVALSQKPSSQWTETDIRNWNYATNNSPIPNAAPNNNPVSVPEQQTGVGVYLENQRNAAANGTQQSGGQGEPTVTSPEGLAALNAARAAQGYDPITTPTSSDQSNPPVNNSTTETPTETNPNDSALLKALHDQIDGTDYSPEQKALLHKIVDDDSVKGNAVRSIDDVAKIVSDAAIKAEADVAPYYDKMTEREINDLKTNMEQIRSEAARYAQTEAVDYAKQLQDTKQSLRARGMTFGGFGRAQLGSDGIIDSAGVAGVIPEARKATWEEKTADFQDRASKVQTTSNRILGNKFPTDVSGTFSTPYGNRPLTVNQTTPTDIGIGDLNAARLKDKALAQTNIIKGYTSYLQ